MQPERAARVNDGALPPRASYEVRSSLLGGLARCPELSSQSRILGRSRPGVQSRWGSPPPPRPWRRIRVDDPFPA